MDHRYIDDRSVAQHYLDHTLSSAERAEFEAHLVDCQECTDRVLLAGMFYVRNGSVRGHVPVASPSSPQAPGPPPTQGPPTTRVKIRFAGSFSPWLFWCLTASGALLALAGVSFLAWLLLAQR